MEILYLWIGNYNKIKEQEFNFSKDFQFHFNHETQKLTVEKKDDRITPLLKTKRIKNITGIIGENGSGKTTLLEFISKWVMNLHIPQVIVCDFGIGYSDSFTQFEYLGNDLYLLQVYPLLGSYTPAEKNIFHINFSNQITLEKKKEIIYYSSIYDMRHVWRHGYYCLDISTNFLVTDPQRNNERVHNGAVLNYKYNELKKHLTFINSKNFIL
jgi:AAA15 family ATPase/GTPase